MESDSHTRDSPNGLEASSGGDFRIGDWSVRPGLHRLEKKGGDPFQVEPKLLGVLTCLAQRAPEVVSRDELLALVWGSTYVSEDLPRRAIYQLRKILGDDPRQPAFIETIPRAGYRLIAPIVWVGKNGVSDRPESVEPEEVEAEKSKGVVSWGRSRILGLVAMGLLAVLVLTLVGLRSLSPPFSSGLVLSPLTTLPGLEYDPAVSPDGSRVAFLRVADSESDSEMSLQVQLIGGEESLQVTDFWADFDHPIRSPTWSPDGTQIAFLRWREPEGWSVAAVPALGGAERNLIDLGTRHASGLDWSPDARNLVVGMRKEPSRAMSLHGITIDTQEIYPLTKAPETSSGDHLPTWSPDGKSIAFIRTLAQDVSEVHVVSASGGKSRSLLDRPKKIADLDWSADGSGLLLAVLEAGRHQVWGIEVASGQVRKHPEFGDSTRWLSVGADGGRWVIGRSRWEFGLWSLDLEKGDLSPEPALSSTFYDEALALSPDGEKVAFASTRSGAYEIWQSELTGHRLQRLTDFADSVVGFPSWFPDGRSLVFHAVSSGQFDLWRVDSDGGSPRPLTRTPFDERVPTVSGDGKSLYFASDRTGEWQVWRMGLDGSEPIQLTDGGGYMARESMDGRWFYYTRWKEDGLWRAPVPDPGSSSGAQGAQDEEGGQGEEKVLELDPQTWSWGNWIPAPEGLYVVTRDSEGKTHLSLFAADAADALRRIPLPDTPVSPSMSRSADGSWMLFAFLNRLESDLVLAEESRPDS